MAFQNIGSGIAYDYGIDARGKMYIWDKWSNKMMYYGDPKKGYDQIITLNVGHGAKTNFQGDKSNGGWKQPAQQKQATAAAPPSNTGTGYAGGGGGYVAPVKPKLDQSQLDALDSMLGNYDRTRSTSKRKAALKRDASLNEKRDEFGREEKKYKGKKLSTLQDFAGSKTDTDINTRDTLENLVSSLSTMGLGGSRALTRQVLDAANRSNRKANETQAKDNQGLDSSFNDYRSGNENDVAKIKDQFGYDTGEAQRKWAEDRQNTYYKKADVYNAAEQDAGRKQWMNKGNDLNSVITGSTFVNPQYKGKTRQMATPELGDYTQSIAQYNTAGVGADASGMPAGEGVPVAPGTNAPGNLAVRAIAVNDRDLGVKKKTEAELGYGV